MGESEISFPNVEFKKPGKLFISMLTTRSEEMPNTNTHLGHLQVNFLFQKYSPNSKMSSLNPTLKFYLEILQWKFALLNPVN